MRTQRYAVQSSVSGSQAPRAAVVGIAVSDSFEIVFDTLGSSRKADNLRSNSRIAFVLGGLVGGDERTVQYEGIADEPSSDEGDRIREVYFNAFPEGRDRLSRPGVTHFRTRPQWLRYSDYNHNPPIIVEFTF
ncbi:MAG TPA: pyridoxamine 5'-phosphate oxidase family protein [Vicinamibacterales bacterium]|nr:pyridoxamine 5'-phosphate oxidase family protein [Vicinamibacterales bacterium]